MSAYKCHWNELSVRGRQKITVVGVYWFYVKRLLLDGPQISDTQVPIW